MPWPEVIPGAVMAGSFRLGRALDGSSGRVHEARHDRLAGRFAVKLFPEAQPGTFQHHARLALALRHPGIAQVIDYGVDAQSGQAFVAMELCQGQSLAALAAVARSSRLLPVERVAMLIHGVAAALQAAHDRGVVHGHLEPDRIVVAAGGETKVIGLALGPDLSDELELSEVTAYTAPEQLEADPDARSDQFALGAIAFELLAGVPPFDDAAERQDPPSLRDRAAHVNVIVDDVIRRALAPDPDERWPNVTIFADRLLEASSGGALEEQTRIAAFPTPDWGGQPTPSPLEIEALPAATPAPITSVEIDIDGPLATAPPTRPLRPVQRALPSPGRRPAFDPLATPPPVPEPVPVDGPWSTTEPTLQTVPGRGGRRVLALLVAGGLAFAGVKLDAWHRARTLIGGLHLPAALAPSAAPASPPPPAPKPPTPPAATPAADDGTAEAENAPARALRPEVVPIPAAPAEPSPPVPAPPARHHRHHRRAAALPPELAAEEAALSDDGETDVDTKPAKQTSDR